MRHLKRILVLSLFALALSGCTKSSISNEAPAMQDVDPGKMTDEDDETLSRDPLIEEETEEQPMYDWEQVKDETDSLFTNNPQYPLGESMTFEADEDAMTIKLTWTVKDGTTAEEAMDYAVILVKQFNDIVAVQSVDLNSSDANSFGDLWDSFALTVQVKTADGNLLVDKAYKAGEKIDLVASETDGEGPTPEEYKGPVKDDSKKK